MEKFSELVAAATKRVATLEQENHRLRGALKRYMALHSRETDGQSNLVADWQAAYDEAARLIL